MTLDEETTERLLMFLDGSTSPQETEAWLASLDDLSDDLATLRLLLAEAGEDVRPMADAKGEAQNILIAAGVITIPTVRTLVVDTNTPISFVGLETSGDVLQRTSA